MYKELRETLIYYVRFCIAFVLKSRYNAIKCLKTKIRSNNEIRKHIYCNYHIIMV